MLYGLAQVRYGLGILAVAHVIVGVCAVPVGHCTVVHRVTAHLYYNVFGIVEPPQLTVTHGQPCTGNAIDGRLCGIQPRHIGECCRCLVELSFLKLRLAHQQPCLPQERIVLPARQPLYILGCFAPVLGPFRPFLYAVLLYCLLALLYCAVKTGLADVAACLVAHNIHRYQFRKVVLVALLFLQRTVDKRLTAVIERVVTGVERVPPASAAGVFLRGAARHGQHDHGGKHYYNMYPIILPHTSLTWKPPLLLL